MTELILHGIIVVVCFIDFGIICFKYKKPDYNAKSLVVKIIDSPWFFGVLTLILMAALIAECYEFGKTSQR